MVRHPTVAIPRTWALSSEGGTDVNDKVVSAAAGLLLVAAGLWAFAAPRSFFESVATYPPFNEHLLHDIGAFNLGLGATLLLALAWADGLLVALAGVGLGATAHALAHWLDRELGGSATDP